MSDASLPGGGEPGESQEPAGDAAGHGPVDTETSDPQEEVVHESVDLPDWVPVVFGLILITIAAAAIWMAAGW